MAFRGRGSGRGGGRGGGRGRGRGAHQPSRLARSGIRTRGGGYKKFDSQRAREVPRESAEPEDQPPTDTSASDIDEDDDESIDQDDNETTGTAYAALLQSFGPPTGSSDVRPSKRRRIDANASTDSSNDNGLSDSAVSEAASESEESDSDHKDTNDHDLDSEDESLADDGSEHLSTQPGEHSDTSEDSTTAVTPYESHFARASGADLADGAEGFLYDATHTEHTSKTARTLFAGTHPPATTASIKKIATAKIKDLPIKPRLAQTANKQPNLQDDLKAAPTPYILSYADVVITNRTPRNAPSLRRLLAMHSINHVLMGRDRVLKNNARFSQAGEDAMLELRDQGFTRPKLLILTETRQMCASYAQCIVDWFQPEQQENKQRFQDSFSMPVEETDMPDDYQELFQGNNDNNFLTTIKFTRKTLKFFSAFYQSDIILASPLGLRRIIENEDKKKQDYDFLSSIELVIVDQADAMQMQSWENVELVLKHLNLQPKELRDCDVNRVRNWYLDGQAKHLRQTIVLSAYLTPEINRLFNTELQNIAGKIKVSETHSGAIQAATGLGIKQTFSRFPSRAPLEDPDARFKFFTSSVLPSLLRLPQPAEGGQGILIFIPSYFDFLRIRNFFATSTMTENVSFGAIHDYSEVSEQRRARSHFLSGKHSILLYTQRAHHFFRLRLRGVKRIVMYGVPDNPIFYEEIVAGYLGSSIEAGIGAGECFSRSIFSKFDALKMERIVGSERVKSMLAGTGDTFEFV